MTTLKPTTLLGRHDAGASLVHTRAGPLSAGVVLGRARALSKRLAADQAVVVACRERDAFVVACLAAWLRGLPVALPPNDAPATMRVVEGQRVTDAAIPAVAPTGEVEAITPRADTPLVVLYTSGTTARPRRLVKTAAQLLVEAAVLADHFELGPGQRVLSTVPPVHIYGLLFGVLVPLVCGASVVAAAPLHAEAVAATISRFGADTLVSTPAHLRALASLNPGALTGLERVFSSGATLPTATAATVKAVTGLCATEVLGSTETGGIAWRVSDGASPPPWTPLPGVQVDEGEQGRLLVSSPFLDPEVEPPLAADDRIELLADGRFVHRGRLDDVVKVAGKRVSLSAVEAHLSAQPGVLDAAVVADDAGQGRGARLLAAVVGPDADAAALRSGLLDAFDPTTVPRKVAVVAAIPRDATGKLSRARLAAVLGRRTEQVPARVLPCDDTDVRVFAIDVPADLRYFAGHFPGDPVLPGAAQLETIVLPQVRAAWPDFGAPSRVRRLKFRRRIGPGDALTLELRRRGASIDFEIRRGTESCASGTLRTQGGRAAGGHDDRPR